MNIKNISKLLIWGILFNNVATNSLAISRVDNINYETYVGNPITIDDWSEGENFYLEVQGNTIFNALKNVEWQPRSSYLYNSDLDIDIAGKTLTLINLSDKPLILSINSNNIVGFNGIFSREVIVPANSHVVEKVLENEALRTFVAYEKYGWNLSTDSKNLMNKLMVLEGEYNEDLIPKEYFEGMLSAGEMDNNIQLTTHNKNLWDGELELGSLNNSDGSNADSTTNLRTKNFIEVEGGRTYTLSNDMGYSNYLYEYDKDKRFIKYDGVKLVTRTVTLNAKTKYVKFRSTMNEVQNNLNVKYLFELSDKQTDYAAPQRNTLNFTLNEPIRCIPNVASDKILNKNGKWVVERNCGERVYNSVTDASNSKILTDGVKTIYKLEEPTYDYLSDDSDISLYEDITYIYAKSDIPVIIRVSVDRSLSLAIEYLQRAIDNPTLENISQARIFINLLEESSLKDQLQNQLNTIVKVEDLEIEKKMASVNIDVYIKSKNSMSMGLSTNYVSFDNFSGVEDMEMKNAVDITVSSSLPYALNAYLEGEIENGDKSNTLDKSILSIKESSKEGYRSFVNTVDKLVLKDNCEYGNFISHSIDLRLNGGIMHEKDVYRTTIKFEAEQK